MASVAGDNGERSDARSKTAPTGPKDEGEPARRYVVSPADGTGPMAPPERRRLVRVLVILLLVVVGAGGWLWWTRPLTREVPLPDGIATDDGLYVQIHGSIPPVETEAGKLQSSRMRSENHEWIGALKWVRRDGTEEIFELRLGETAHIDGLGTVTLLGVNPKPLIPNYESGGWTYKVYIVLDPGVEEIIR